MGAPNDPRVMSPEELAQYAAQFRENGDDDSNVNLYDVRLLLPPPPPPPFSLKKKEEIVENRQKKM